MAIKLPVETGEEIIPLEIEELRVIEAVSPTVAAERNEEGVLITVHDLNGTRTAQVYDGEKGDKGDKGDTGTVFTPNVSAEGIITWSNDGGLENPTTVDLGDVFVKEAEIPHNTSDLNNDAGFITLAEVPPSAQADWNEADSSDPAFIVNRPNITTTSVTSSTQLVYSNLFVGQERIGDEATGWLYFTLPMRDYNFNVVDISNAVNPYLNVGQNFSYRIADIPSVKTEGIPIWAETSYSDYYMVNTMNTRIYDPNHEIMEPNTTIEITITDNISENTLHLNDPVVQAAGKVSAGTVQSPAVPTAANDLTTKQYVDNAVSSVQTMQIHICSAAEYNAQTGIPTIQNPDTKTFYLVPGSAAPNLYVEWIYVNNAWEQFGQATLDLSGYALKINTELDTTLSRGRKSGTTTGSASFAFGDEVEASGEYSQATGYGTIASGGGASAEGTYTSATSINAHAEGFYTIASGQSSHAEGFYNVASGNYSHAEGGGPSSSQASTASGVGSHAEGAKTQATGKGSHSEGGGTVSNGNYSHAEGMQTIANGTATHVEGKYNVGDTYASWPEWVANTEYTVGYCVKRTVTENGNTTITGYSCKTANSDAVFTESNWNVDGYYNFVHIVGNGANGNNRSNAYALGWDGTGHFAGDVYVHANADSTGGTKLASANEVPVESGSAAGAVQTKQFEYNSQPSVQIASGAGSFAEGTGTIASAAWAHAEGQNTTASGTGSHSEGAFTIAEGYYSHAGGSGTIAAGRNSFTYGAYNVEDSYNNFPEWIANTEYAVGDKVRVNATDSNGDPLVRGYVCKTANTDDTFIKSKWTSLAGKMNYVEIIGNGTTTTRSNARALDWDGNEHLAGDVYVHANSDSSGGVKVATVEDIPLEAGSAAGAVQTKSFDYSGQIFVQTASKEGAFAEGIGASATNIGAHAEGSGSVASGGYSHAEGNNTYASALAAHSEGQMTFASGKWSHAEGTYTIAASQRQHVQGKYNISDDQNTYAHIVGNGTADNARSNAHTLDWNGNAWYAGKVSAGTVNSPANPTAANDLATKDYVDTAINATANLKHHICSAAEYDSTTKVPTIQNPDVNMLYLVPGGTGSNLYVEWWYPNGAWEQLGQATLDLTNYVQFTDYATDSTAGVVKYNTANGINVTSSGVIKIVGANASNIKGGTESYRPIIPAMQHNSVFYGLAKAAGDSTQSASDNAVGTYTAAAQTAIQNMLGVQPGPEVIRLI